MLDLLEREALTKQAVTVIGKFEKMRNAIPCDLARLGCVLFEDDGLFRYEQGGGTDH